MSRLVLALLLTAFAVIAHAQINTEEVGIDEKLGQYLPADLVFLDEQGDSLRLGGITDRPILLTLVYYTCPGICTPLLNEVAQVIGRTRAEPGKDYTLVSVSIDPQDTPELARKKKANYLGLIEREDFGPEHWRFLVGDSTSIAGITEAVGFKYKKDGGEYLHSGAVIAISPDGMVSRYLYGTDFLPFDFRMAVVEAAKGKIQPTVTRLLAYCFSYDPESRTYVFALFKVFGTVMLAFIAGLALVLAFAGKRRTRTQKGQAA